jgi:hypothetical protein
MHRSLPLMVVFCACTPKAASLKDVHDMTALVTVDSAKVTVTLGQESGPWRDCPVLQEDAKLTLDGQDVPLVSNGSGDDAGCHQKTAFSIARASISNPSNATSTFTLSDSTASFSFSVSELLADRTLDWQQPSNHVLSPGSAAVLAWSGAQDVMDCAPSGDGGPERCHAEGRKGSGTAFESGLTTPSAGHLAFTVTSLPSGAAGNGTLSVTAYFRRGTSQCQGFTRCQGDSELHAQDFPAEFQP